MKVGGLDQFCLVEATGRSVVRGVTQCGVIRRVTGIGFFYRVIGLGTRREVTGVIRMEWRQMSVGNKVPRLCLS